MRSRIFLSGVGLLLLATLGVMVAVRNSAPAPRAPAVNSTVSPRAPNEPHEAADEYLGVVIPEEAVDISSRVDGRLESVKVQVGGTVRQAEVLAVIDTRVPRQELAIAEAVLLSSRAEQQAAELALAQVDERLERRADPRQLVLGALSEEELSTVRYDQRVATVKLDVAKAKVKEQQARVAKLQEDILEATLRAPFDGVVASRHVDPGTMVRSGQSILYLLRSGPRQVRFAVPEQDVQRMEVGLRVRIRLAEQQGEFDGRVSNLAPEVDAASRMMLAVARMEDSQKRMSLPSGTVVRVSVEPDRRQEPAAQPFARKP